MEWTLFLGLLVALAVFAAVWFAFVVPSERRDHERRLAIVRKRLAEHEQSLRDSAAERGEAVADESSGRGAANDPDEDSLRTGG